MSSRPNPKPSAVNNAQKSKPAAQRSAVDVAVTQMVVKEAGNILKTAAAATKARTAEAADSEGSGPKPERSVGDVAVTQMVVKAAGDILKTKVAETKVKAVEQAAAAAAAVDGDRREADGKPRRSGGRM